MDITLGRLVRTYDGDVIGTVDRLVLDPDTRELLELIVHKGHLLTTDRIVDRSHVEEVDQDGTVYLNVLTRDLDTLPVFIAHERIVSAGPDAGSAPYPVGGGLTMDMPILWRSKPRGSHLHHVSGRQYDAAVADAAEVEVRSNLPENSTTISHGTDVLDRKEQRIGSVHELIYNDSGEIEEIVARRGIVHHHDLRIPIGWVETITRGWIMLSVRASEVETENARWAAHDWSGKRQEPSS